MRAKEIKDELVEVVRYLGKVDLATRAAAVSYYAMLASIPLLALFVTLAVRLLPDLQGPASAAGIGDLTVQELNSALSKLLPGEARELVTGELSRLQSQPPVGLLSIGLVMTLWTSSNAFLAILNAINNIYDVDDRRPIWKVRLITLSLPLILAAVVIVALVCIILLPAIISLLQLDHFGMLFLLGQWIVLFAIVLAAFGITYRYAPASDAKERIITKGSIIGALLFLLASMFFQAYVQQYGSYDKVYGSLGGAIIFMVWLWLVSACLLLGSAINKSERNRAENSAGGSGRDTTFGTGADRRIQEFG